MSEGKKEETKIIQKRRELIFVYSARDCNPNGDPDDENRPRTDDEGYVLVSDVRLKRTIRDYLLTSGSKILIRRDYNSDGGILNMEDLIRQNLSDADAGSRTAIMKKIPELFIDARLFGFVATVKNANCSLTGPIQFAIGKSLNKPTITTHTITSVMSAASERGGAIGNFHILDYALIRFQGVICPKLAKETGMTKNDLDTFYKALLKGTQTLNTRSKFNHVPKLLLSFRSKDAEFLCGELAYHLEIENGEDQKSDPIIVLDKLVDRIKHLGKKDIEALEYYCPADLKLKYNKIEYTKFSELWTATSLKDNIKLEPIKF